MLKIAVDPYSQFYKTLKNCLSNETTIKICEKMVSQDSKFIAQKLYYDLINFNYIEFEKDSEARLVFKILVASEDYIFSEKEKDLFIKHLYVKVRSMDYYKSKYLGGG